MKQKHPVHHEWLFGHISSADHRLASAGITTDRKDKSIIYAQKLDTKIWRDRFAEFRAKIAAAKLDRNENGVIEKHEFNARLITMFNRMDRDGDRMLRRDELPGHSHGEKKHQHDNKASNPLKNT